MAFRLNIMAKLLMILLVLTVVPLALIGYLALNDEKAMGNSAVEQARRMGNSAIADSKSMGNIAIEESTQALNMLGEKMIQIQATNIAKQIEIYVKMHPNMTVLDLQKDSYFQSIAVQHVGKTGYTALTDVNTLICRFHSNPKIVNLDLHNLSAKLPGFWSVMVKSQGGKEVYGYYDWAESDGSIKQKYMHISIVNATTNDGIIFSVAATTYIDEFSAPVTQTKENINKAIEETGKKIEAYNTATETRIKQSTEGVSTKNTIFIITAITILVVIAIGYIFARSITKPVTELTNVANKIINGNLDVQIKVSSNDEIKDLATAIEALVGAVKFFRKGESK